MFNISKIKSAQVNNYENMLRSQTDKDETSLSGEVTPSYEGILKEQREKESYDNIQESRLDEVRKDALDISEEGTLEANMDKNLIISNRANITKPQVKDIDVLSEAYDQKARKEMAEGSGDNLKKENDFWDKYIGAQLDNEKTTIKSQVPVKGSQLQNRPERFKDFKSVPSDLDQSKNMECHTKDHNISPMSVFSKNKINMIKESIKDADAVLFNIYATAIKESRDLNSEDKNIIDKISRDKIYLLSHVIEYQRESYEERYPKQDFVHIVYPYEKDVPVSTILSWASDAYVDYGVIKDQKDISLDEAKKFLEDIGHVTFGSINEDIIKENAIITKNRNFGDRNKIYSLSQREYIDNIDKEYEVGNSDLMDATEFLDTHDDLESIPGANIIPGRRDRMLDEDNFEDEMTEEDQDNLFIGKESNDEGEFDDHLDDMDSEMMEDMRRYREEKKDYEAEIRERNRDRPFDIG